MEMTIMPRSAATPASRKPRSSPKTVTAIKTSAPAKTSKSAQLRALLTSPEGATLAEMQSATGWQAHTVRAWLSRGGGSTKAPGPKCTRGDDGRYRQPAE